MRSFLLLLGTQMLSQITASGHGDANVCVASFYNDAIAGGHSDASNAVVIVTENSELPAGNEIDLGAMITESGAWMTIGDGAFVTIDTDKLDCGLGGCSDHTNHGQLGYNKHSDEVVSCEDDGHHDDDDDEPKMVRLVLDGNYNEVVGDNKDGFLAECTINLSGGGATDVICTDVRAGSIIVDVGGSNPGEIAAAVLEVRASGLDLPSFDSLDAVKPSARVLQICPQFDEDSTFEEGNAYYCYDQGHRIEDYLESHTKENCNERGHVWKEAQRQTCGEILTYIEDRGGLDGDMDEGGSEFRWQFMQNCCDLDSSYELPTENCESFNKDGVIDPVHGITCERAARYIVSLGGPDKLQNQMQMTGYNVMCCNIVSDVVKSECPNYDMDTIFDDGEHMYTCKENTDLDFFQCKESGFNWEKLPPTKCGNVASMIDFAGYDSLDEYARGIFKDRCCGLPPTAPNDCQDFDAKKVMYEKYEACVVDKHDTHDYDKSESDCKDSGAFWQVYPETNCGDAALYYTSDYYHGDASTEYYLKSECCPNFDGTPPPTTSWFWSYDTSSSSYSYDTTSAASCPATCGGKTCDEWLGKTSFTCSSLEDTYGCNCGGCECTADDAQDECAADLCYERTCPEWEGKHGVKCEILKDVFGCSCNGCNCAKTLNKCDKPQHKGDNYCDDGNNVQRCDWDGGDCCDLDGPETEHANQFVYCKECECRDPEGQPVASGCLLKQYQGDEHCDDGNNKLSCGWDGGDCCGNVDTTYCDKCLCKDPSHTGSRCIATHQNDGFCDDANNNPQCGYDRGDCCNNGHSGQFRYCTECACKDPSAHSNECGGQCGSDKHKGDLYCDDDNNNCGCGWDGGDCCGKTGNVKQLKYCFKCACLDPGFEAPACPVAQFKGDGICDDDNNIESCGWDSGDCCDKGDAADKNQFKFCEKCQEHSCNMF